jgi:formylglycine-generating enzyme required for sulfatase activity
VHEERLRPLPLKWLALAATLLVLAVAGSLYFLWRPPLVIPDGTSPDEAAQVVKVGGNRYYDRIVRVLSDETPVRFLLVPATPGDDLSTFYIMEHKVSNRLFEQFANEQPQSIDKESGWRQGGAMDQKDAGIDNQDWPVFRVSANEAHEFARWIGGRLPSIRQWDKAAGLHLESDSPGPYLASWDSSSKTEIAVNRLLEGPLPVGTASKDVSPSGCRDMAGNGFEWTRTVIVPAHGYVPREFPDLQEEDMLILRGQSYINDEPLRYDTLRDIKQDQMQAVDEPRFDVSFRVVIDALP